MKLEKEFKIYANRGVKRNKKPLKNIVYLVDICQLNPDVDVKYFEKYKYKDEGYLALSWYYESKDPMINWSGLITPDDLKNLLGDEQWRKLSIGKRKFILQRRINRKNI